MERRKDNTKIKKLKVRGTLSLLSCLVILLFVVVFSPNKALASCAFECCPSLNSYHNQILKMSCDNGYCYKFYTAGYEGHQGGIFNPVVPGTRGEATKKLGQLISGVLGVLLIGAGIASFLYFLLGGIQWITSGGDKAGVEAARQKILNALIGLIIVFATWAVMKFVFAFLGMEFPYFSLPSLVGK